MDFAVPADHKGKIKEIGKTNKYLDLARELKRRLNIKVKRISIVVGTVPKCSEKEYMNSIPPLIFNFSCLFPSLLGPFQAHKLQTWYPPLLSWITTFFLLLQAPSICLSLSSLFFPHLCTLFNVKYCLCIYYMCFWLMHPPKPNPLL